MADSIEYLIGRPPLALITVAATRPPNVVGVRFQTTWIRLPPPAAGLIVAETKLPGVQKLLSRTVQVTVSGSDQS